MRESNRTAILSAAHRVVERGGLTSVTFEAVAAESGLTKGGLLYHFPSKEALMLGIHEHMVGQWEESLLAELGKPYDEATESERLRAYVRNSVLAATRAELMLMLDAHSDPRYLASWVQVAQRWTPAPREELDESELDRVIAHLAADGLWLYEAVNGVPLSDALRDRLADQISAGLAD